MTGKKLPEWNNLDACDERDSVVLHPETNVRPENQETPGIVTDGVGSRLFNEREPGRKKPERAPLLEKADGDPPDDREPLETVDLRPRLSPAEKGSRFFFLLCAVLAMGQMLLIMVFLFGEAVGLFLEQAGSPRVALGSFLFGTDWYPTYPEPSFGSFALVAGSLAVTFVSTLLAGPLGLGLAVFLSCLAGRRTREWVKPAVELLASVPSVVLGLVGMMVVAPFLQETLNLPTGLNLLNSSLILAVMAAPTIASLGEDALSAVPRDIQDASYALGATRWETVWRVTMPAALGGLSTAVILGLGRSLGETVVVLMVAGGAAQIPNSLFDSVRPLTSTLAAEMGETAIGSSHYQALFSLGVVLFFMTLAFNLLAWHLSRRWRTGR
ncbi:MAG: phosphate ABC transporter permease subunit PstC [Deltaproteobacteria bacterium]|jgi:phosphate transport system permease protein|nr:phosphate ABC transporter permease subunit PstC [Deltaproteobacteria bacterium]